MFKVLILLPFLSFSQDFITPYPVILPPPTQDTFSIYNINSLGVPSITPSQVIEVNQNSINIFNTSDTGFKEITPTQTVEIKKDVIEVYDVNKNGVKEITPIKIIKKEEF